MTDYTIADWDIVGIKKIPWTLYPKPYILYLCPER